MKLNGVESDAPIQRRRVVGTKLSPNSARFAVWSAFNPRTFIRARRFFCSDESMRQLWVSGKITSNGNYPLTYAGNVPILPAMMEVGDISDDAIRQNLLARATAFSDRTGYSFSRIGEEAIRDSKFLANVKSGRNFTVKTYQRVIDWMDEAERSPTRQNTAA